MQSESEKLRELRAWVTRNTYVDGRLVPEGRRASSISVVYAKDLLAEIDRLVAPEEEIPTMQCNEIDVSEHD